jgi:hypothetical protein
LSGVPGCHADRVSLLDQSRRLGELAGMQMNAGAVRQRDGKDGKRACFAREAQRATGQLMPRLVIPQFSCEGLPRYAQRSPKPTHVVAVAAVSSSECRERRDDRPLRRPHARFHDAQPAQRHACNTRCGRPGHRGPAGCTARCLTWAASRRPTLARESELGDKRAMRRSER